MTHLELCSPETGVRPSLGIQWEVIKTRSVLGMHGTWIRSTAHQLKFPNSVLFVISLNSLVAEYTTSRVTKADCGWRFRDITFLHLKLRSSNWRWNFFLTFQSEFHWTKNFDAISGANHSISMFTWCSRNARLWRRIDDCLFTKFVNHFRVKLRT